MNTPTATISTPLDPKVSAAIANIPEEAWRPIKHRRAVWDEQRACRVSEINVAEVAHTAFTSRKGQAVSARLIVRRVGDLYRKAAQGQGELFPL